MAFRRHNFTLIELAVVVAILILLTAVSSVYLGRDRRGSEFERSLRDFQVFCARARSASMQDGAVRKIVFYPEENVYRPLATVSPVVRALAQEQFDDYVKRVRVFAAPEVSPTLRLLTNFNARFARAVDEFEADVRR